VAKVNIKGPIVSDNDAWIYEWLDIKATCPKIVNDAIDKANGEDLEVIINSGGGSVFAASEIYTALKSYMGNVTVKIVGMAASAASVIAMAGKKVMMTPTGQMMIHNVTTYAEGDYRDMEHTADILKTANDTIANAYRLKSGKTQEELLALMDDETWMDAKKAKELGLIDEIMFEDVQLAASAGYSGLLPPEVINTVRNKLQGEKALKAAHAKLNFLKLKGEVISD
jgi:ATP-dependent Clp protease protease subunit